MERRTKRDFRFGVTRLCFTLPATLGDRGLPTPYERLEEPADLARWCVEAGLLPTPPVVDERDLEAAWALRETIQRTGVAIAGGAPPRERDVASINRAAAAVPLVPRLSADGTSSHWSGTTVDSVLSLLARDAIDLFAGPLRGRVKICADETCLGLFVDESRPGQRRWCSMSTCGDKAKKSAYRARLRSQN
ncbi:CGNR zinc finger domain-containing protein [Amycolatopsis sp. NPDC059657]|uniref:CGNR zinc finger domain-containing protein n=1 Tax=Amycolatopsis sp. NPDC059657 TaxID=3346899 RepID=UPI00366B0D6F